MATVKISSKRMPNWNRNRSITLATSRSDKYKLNAPTPAKAINIVQPFFSLNANQRYCSDIQSRHTTITSAAAA